MRIFIAPIALGGRGARMSLEGEGADSIEHAQHARLDATWTRRRGRADRGAAQRVVESSRGLRVRCSPGSSRSSAASPSVARDGDGAAAADRCRARATSSREGDSVRGQRRLPDGGRPGRTAASPPTSAPRPSRAARSARSPRATASTSSCRCGRPTGSAATSCRATSTASARARSSSDGGHGRDVRFAAPAGAAALRGREGLRRRSTASASRSPTWTTPASPSR